MIRIHSVIFIALLIISCRNSENKTHLAAVDQDIMISQNTLQESITRGNLVYSDFCIQCHMADGLGDPKQFPPLAESNWLTEKRRESIHAIKYGQIGQIVVNDVKYDGVMAPMGLSDREIADVLNYVMNSWGNSQDKIVTEEEVLAVEK